MSDDILAMMTNPTAEQAEQILEVLVEHMLIETDYDEAVEFLLNLLELPTVH